MALRPAQKYTLYLTLALNQKTGQRIGCPVFWGFDQFAVLLFKKPLH
jgi:hypothetical protein